jgi:hypothetical protein
MLKTDSLRLGLVLGFLAPMLGVFLFYFLKASSTPFFLFLKYVLQNKPFLTTVVSTSLLANAVIFTIYINTRKDRTAKGIFIVTVVYAVAAIILKMFL